MTRGHREDPGLDAVRRVRSSREQDSGLGLRRALTLAGLRAEELAALRDRLAEATLFTTGSPTEFAAHVDRSARLAEAEEEAAVRADDSAMVATEATGRWQHDRRQLRAVEGLLERRSLARAAERARAEARELDDLASQAWLRSRSGEELQ